MKAIEYLKQHRVYEDEIIYNSVDEIVGTVSQLMEDYAALRQPNVVGQSGHMYCPSCRSTEIHFISNVSYVCNNCGCRVN